VLPDSDAVLAARIGWRRMPDPAMDARCRCGDDGATPRASLLISERPLARAPPRGIRTNPAFAGTYNYRRTARSRRCSGHSCKPARRWQRDVPSGIRGCGIATAR
jgi:hypothetical protein